ncbi:MAG: KEOPS complex subunit Cgi121 [Methanomassiliicoccales archaeon]
MNIVGARGKMANPKVLVEALQTLSSGQGLALNADLVCGADHLRSAVAHAERAFERGSNVSSTLAMETMLYASGERQISRAMKKLGMREGVERLAIVLFDVEDVDRTLHSLELTRDDSVLEPSTAKITRFGISERETKAIPEETWPDLVLERVAFVELQK